MPPVLLKDLNEALTATAIYEQKTRLKPKELDALKTTLPVAKYDQAFMPIFGFGEQADHIYFVLSGSVLTYEKMTGTTVLAFDRILTGGFFGEVGTLYDNRRSANAVSLEKTELLLLKMSDFNAFQQQHPDIVKEVLIKGMAERLSRSGKDLADARLRDAKAVPETEPGAWDRFILGAAGFLGSGWFLLVLLVALLAWASWWQKIDPSTMWIALTLSLTQIVIGNLVLNSQARAARLEAAVTKRVNEAIMKADETITTVRAEQKLLPAEIREEIQRQIRDTQKQP